MATDAIPVGQITHCRSCGAQIIFLRMPSGKLHPTNSETVEEDEVDFVWGKHVSHFATCPEADRWRKR
jgi:hypothetical protein